MTLLPEIKTTYSKPAAYILAGGLATRMKSRDKARIVYAGKPLILHVADALRWVADEPVAVGKSSYADLGLHTISDIQPNLGPMGGLQAAMAHRKNGWILLAPNDQLGIEESWLHLLLASRHGQRAVAFRSDYWQTLPALYHCELQNLVDEMIQNNELSLWRLLQKAGAAQLETPFGWRKLRDCNSLDCTHRGLPHENSLLHKSLPL